MLLLFSGWSDRKCGVSSQTSSEVSCHAKRRKDVVRGTERPSGSGTPFALPCLGEVHWRGGIGEICDFNVPLDL